MTLHWHELSGPEVQDLSKKTEVAILPIGCVEMHGPHLPTGSDAIIAQRIAELIAERELAIILPTLYYNINDCMACYPGTLAFPPDVVKGIIEALCREAARNGFPKIAILVWHGDSDLVPKYWQLELLAEQNASDPIPFQVFTIVPYVNMETTKVPWETTRKDQGHACEHETSQVLAVRPDLVHLERLEKLPEGQGPFIQPHVPYATYQIPWIRQVPKGYIGFPHYSTVEKGHQCLEEIADWCAEIIHHIKTFDIDRDP